MPEPVRVVFDTNVLLSLFVFADSRFAPLRGEVVSGHWVALTSPPCLAEYQRVLGYPLFELSAEQQAAAYAAYLELVQIIDGPPRSEIVLPKCQDKDDQKFLELARDGQAHWLVTADKLLLKLRRGRRLDHLFRVFTPDEALQKVGAGETAPAAPLSC
ncbi:MAG: putative toxin-antitoxin system toxin component, PIN family [Rhodocyclaceae bacterium]|nr:putative toxin-antitoxin system toxin component, PIN family [Rhodocyclaceae bacterium]MDZ4215974.1 putative toxin-antitoxin system toxin component, PIN family [Rhodocyclaceae bacterium]